MINDEHLEAAGQQLKPEMFEVREERTYTGEGEMMDTENTIVIVHGEASSKCRMDLLGIV